MLIKLQNFFVDESGATAIDYTLILAFVFLALTAGAQSMSLSLENLFDYVSDNVTNSIPDR